MARIGDEIMKVAGGGSWPDRVLRNSVLLLFVSIGFTIVRRMT